MESFIEWARGPLFRFAFIIMVLGLLRHWLMTVIGVRRAMHQAADKVLPYKAIYRATLSWLFPINKLKERPFYTLTSIIFHIGLILVPIFYAAHVLLWQRGLGVSWPYFPQLLADVLTITTIITAFMLFFARVFDPATRALSRFQDYTLPPLLAIPFLTGFLASHPAMSPFSYNSMILVHVLSANLVMFLVPFTKMSHAILVPSTQLVSEVGWHFPADAGERVAVVLQKENQPI